MVCSATDFYNSVISVSVCLMLLLVDEKVSKKLYQVCKFVPFSNKFKY